MRVTAVYDSLKDLKDWAAVVVLFSGVALKLVSYVFGDAWGRGADAVSGVLLVLGVILLFACRLLFRDDARLTALLADPPAGTRPRPLTADERRYVRTRWARRSATLRGVFAAAVTAAAVLAYAHLLLPWRERWRTARPDRLPFATVVDADAGDDGAWQSAAPFVEAVYTRLETTGADVLAGDPRKKFRVLRYRSAPLGHPCPPFEAVYRYDPDRYRVAGYGLLRHGPAYAPVLAEYRASDVQGVKVDNLLVLRVPAAAAGDEVSLLLRVTLTAGGDFPDDFAAVLTPLATAP